jgi:hypothetical protein
MRANQEECERWLVHYREWRSYPDRKMHQLKPKPYGWDLWYQGKDPLNLSKTEKICCHGGGLVSESWTPSANPVSLPAQNATQPDLL